MELLLIITIFMTLVLSGYLYIAFFKDVEEDGDCPLQKILNERAEFIV
jgi:hypothetical protein